MRQPIDRALVAIGIVGAVMLILLAVALWKWLTYGGWDLV